MAYTFFAPNRAISGTELYIIVNGFPDNLPQAEWHSHYLRGWELVDWTGKVIEGCTVEYSYLNGSEPAHEGIDGKLWCGYPPLTIHLTLGPEGQRAGEYLFSFTLDCVSAGQTSLDQGISQQIDVPLFIAQPPLPLHSSAHPIPNLEAWEYHMIELADKWATTVDWSYDTGSTYLEVGRYLHDSTRYWNAAYQDALAYRNYLMNDCQPPGCAAVWQVYPRGQRQMYQATHDQAWLDALKAMTSGGWVYYGGTADPLGMRETAYAAAVWLELEWVQAGDREMLDRSITYLLGQFNLLCGQEYGRGQGMVCEPFFFGLAMQSVIDYYDLVPDQRIPQALMGTCAWLWENAVDAKTGYVDYDVWVSGGQAGDNADAYTSLNPLMYNAWGFLYQITGNDLYRKQGDILFEHQFDDNNYQWSPKQFAQTYRRSTDYVTRWRA